MKHKDKKLVEAVDYLIKVLEDYQDFEHYLNRLDFVAKRLNRNQEFHKALYDELKLEELNYFLDEVSMINRKLN